MNSHYEMGSLVNSITVAHSSWIDKDVMYTLGLMMLTKANMVNEKVKSQHTKTTHLSYVSEERSCMDMGYI